MSKTDDQNPWQLGLLGAVLIAMILIALMLRNAK